MDGGLRDKRQPKHTKESIDPSQGGEGGEDRIKRFVSDAGNRDMRDLGRSDCCPCADKWLRGKIKTDAASEVS